MPAVCRPPAPLFALGMRSLEGKRSSSRGGEERTGSGEPGNAIVPGTGCPGTGLCPGADVHVTRDRTAGAVESRRCSRGWWSPRPPRQREENPRRLPCHPHPSGEGKRMPAGCRNPGQHLVASPFRSNGGGQSQRLAGCIPQSQGFVRAREKGMTQGFKEVGIEPPDGVRSSCRAFPS